MFLSLYQYLVLNGPESEGPRSTERLPLSFILVVDNLDKMGLGQNETDNTSSRVANLRDSCKTMTASSVLI